MDDIIGYDPPDPLIKIIINEMIKCEDPDNEQKIINRFRNELNADLQFITIEVIKISIFIAELKQDYFYMQLENQKYWLKILENLN